jgi:PAS domain S-box-containing protein
MTQRQIGRLRHLVLLWIAGSLAIGLITAVCFRLNLSLATTGFLFLIVIVLLSLMDSLVSSLVFSAIAVGCLNFFFAPPIFSFEIANFHDLFAITAFFLTSLVITSLVRKLGRAVEMQRRQARQLELTHDAIVSSDVNGAIVYWNRAAEELYGWSREEVLGKQPQILLQTEFPVPFDEIKDTLARTGRWEGELGHTRRDGAKLRVASRWSLQRDETGEPVGRITISNDITERQRTEKALRESEQRFRVLVQGVTDYALYMLDPTGHIANWNIGAERIKGYTAAEIVGQHFSKFYAPEDVAAGLPEKGLITAAREGRYESEGWRLRKDGTKFWAAVIIDAIKDDTGKLIGFAKIARDVTERKAAEETRRRSQAAYLAEAQRLSHTGSFGWDMATDDFTWSDETFRIFGYDPTTKPSMELALQRVHPDDEVRVREVLEQARNNRQEFELEHRLVMPDGTVKTVHVRARALTEKVAGEPQTPATAQFVGAVMDVTARTEAYAALVRSERRYQNLFRAMAISFLEVDWSRSAEMLRSLRQAGVTDFRGYFKEHPAFLRELMTATRIVDINDQTIAVFGLRGSRGEMLRHWPEENWPAESWPTYIDAVISSLNRESYFSAETRLRRSDGSVFDAQITVWSSTENKTAGFIAVTDISQRKQAFSALERSEHRYRDLFDHVPVALMQLRTQGRVRRGRVMEQLRSEGVSDFLGYLNRHPEFVRDAVDGLTIEAVNEQAIRMFGARNAEELIALQNAWIWRERPDTFRRILESRFHRKWTYQEETRIRTLDGRALDVFFTIARPERFDSDSGHILYGFIDITETVRTREKLQTIEAEFAHAARLSLLGELAASIAHEVNQPLAAVAASGEAGLRWLNRAEPNIAEASSAMRRIVADARRAGDIITRIRGMAAGRAPQQVSLSLGEVIEEGLMTLRHELQSKRIEVLLDLAPGLPPVLADRIQLQQVIVNLAINAVQAMAQSSSTRRLLAVATARFDAGKLMCSVEDSGPGIAQQHLDHLFQSFFTTRESGMGLGLSISRSIIEGHGGSLRVDNGSAYGGARFTFTLPTAPGISEVARALG